MITEKILWGTWIHGESVYGPGYQMAPWDTSAWDAFEENAGKKVSILHYGQAAWWKEPFGPWMNDRIVNRGAYVYLDMACEAAELEDIIEGIHDASLIEWANAARSWGRPFFFRWNGEMNIKGMDPARFIAAWRRMRDICDRQGAINITWVWCPNQAFPEDATPISAWYPGDEHVDWLGFDAYNWGIDSGLPTEWTSAHKAYKYTYDQLVAINADKPIIVSETSSSEKGGSKAEWITDLLSVQIPEAFPRIRAVVWFNWNILEFGRVQQWAIESSPEARAAFQRAISSPRYVAGGTLGEIVGLRKIRPPSARASARVQMPD